MTFVHHGRKKIRSVKRNRWKLFLTFFRWTFFRHKKCSYRWKSSISTLLWLNFFSRSSMICELRLYLYSTNVLSVELSPSYCSALLCCFTFWLIKTVCSCAYFFFSLLLLISCIRSCMVVWSFVHISATYTPLAHGILNFRLLYWPRKKTHTHTDWIHLENVWFVKMWQCGNVSTTETTTRKKWLADCV